MISHIYYRHPYVLSVIKLQLAEQLRQVATRGHGPCMCRACALFLCFPLGVEVRLGNKPNSMELWKQGAMTLPQVEEPSPMTASRYCLRVLGRRLAKGQRAPVLCSLFSRFSTQQFCRSEHAVRERCDKIARA